MATLVGREGGEGTGRETQLDLSPLRAAVLAAQDILIRSSKTISDRTETSSSAADVTKLVGLIEKKLILHKSHSLGGVAFPQIYPEIPILYDPLHKVNIFTQISIH